MWRRLCLMLTIVVVDALRPQTCTFSYPELKASLILGQHNTWWFHDRPRLIKGWTSLALRFDRLAKFPYSRTSLLSLVPRSYPRNAECDLLLSNFGDLEGLSGSSNPHPDCHCLSPDYLPWSVTQQYRLDMIKNRLYVSSELHNKPCYCEVNERIPYPMWWYRGHNYDAMYRIDGGPVGAEEQSPLISCLLTQRPQNFAVMSCEMSCYMGASDNTVSCETVMDRRWDLVVLARGTMDFMLRDICRKNINCVYVHGSSVKAHRFSGRACLSPDGLCSAIKRHGGIYHESTTQASLPCEFRFSYLSDGRMIVKVEWSGPTGPIYVSEEKYGRVIGKQAATFVGIATVTPRSVDQPWSNLTLSPATDGRYFCRVTANRLEYMSPVVIIGQLPDSEKEMPEDVHYVDIKTKPVYNDVLIEPSIIIISPLVIVTIVCFLLAGVGFSCLRGRCMSPMGRALAASTMTILLTQFVFTTARN
ncbi:membrane protein TE9 [Testudinid alphaherpesvirus 3]|uniref:Membrane protein TE9 n=1 Tax=Testudinid alphaherpesvirus 3 TaxID=2560801 RepID=A0A0M3LCZ6_9ALPH|nr:membrane protein TE9 [Testudinid alphaherpesvirus 3]AIU39319.1 membrane protein TE9 [Testudinid alphaherpesvirus 3]